MIIPEVQKNQLEEKLLKFRQQLELENRWAKKWKKFREHSRKEKYDGVVQERANKGANETKVKQLLDGRSAPLKKT